MNALFTAVREVCAFMSERQWEETGRELERIRREKLRGMPYDWEEGIKAAFPEYTETLPFVFTGYRRLSGP